MIEVVSAEDVLATARSCLGVQGSPAGALDEAYLAAAARRLAGQRCPCSPRTLVRALVDGNHGLVASDEELEDRAEDAVEALVAVGDLLELGEVAIESDHVKGTWLFAAPPSFVPRESGSVFVLGVAADEQTPLPSEMLGRLRVRGAVRVLEPEPGEDLAATLRDLGLRELSVEAWRRCPRQEGAAPLVAGMDARLSASGQRQSSPVPGLVVLDGRRSTRSYRRRWCAPDRQSGRYVVRRPQAYGADLWGYAELRDGGVVSLLDLPTGGRWRACDIAWRLQMAMDALAGRPQEYRVAGVASGFRLDFFSPIPDWARRRLAAIGEEVEAESCLMSFVVPGAELGAEERFLGELLFLSRVRDTGEA